MTRAPLSHFAQQVADRDGISLAEAIALLAQDNHLPAPSRPVADLAAVIVVEHSDGSLECGDRFTERLAERFAHLLRSYVGRVNFAEVVARNRTAEYRENHSCASHDFCDANMTMLAVFEELGFNSDQVVDGVGDESNWVHREWCAAWDRFVDNCNSHGYPQFSKA